MSNEKNPDRAWSRTPSPSKDPDAGLRGLDHYQRRLPQWRYQLRQHLIPILRSETPYLAKVQQTCRSPILDQYFALTANLGTHTFFMAALPVCFWCGYPNVGVALVHMLALGVYLSGYVKDMLCLPRPLSPPMERITMSGSAALEYGFPSTHTTNAVSVAMYCLFQLSGSRESISPLVYNILATLFYCYAASISVGRIYCGMHGFCDVIIGGLLGAAIAWLEIACGPAFNGWILAGGWPNLGITLVICGLAVRFHSEPADNCPCFDDSVAFTGVVMGVELGRWDYAARNPASTSNTPDLNWLQTFSSEDLIKATMKIVGGIVIVFLWRAAMKPLLLRGLPPIFRFVDHWGFRLPRRYFLQARYYKSVPPLRRDDNVLPQASDIPTMLSNTRKRTISVGPQSEADVREFIANRDSQRRKDSQFAASSGRSSQRFPIGTLPFPSPSIGDIAVQTPICEKPSETLQQQPGTALNNSKQSVSNASLQVNNAPDRGLLTPPLSSDGASSDSGKEDEQYDRQMFSALEKPRIRYDVEVITKIIVYAGIAWLAVEGNPLLFERLGLL